MSNDLRSTIRDQLLKVLSEGDVVDLSQYKSSKSQFGQIGTNDKKIYYLELNGFPYTCHYKINGGSRYLPFSFIKEHPGSKSDRGAGKRSNIHMNNQIRIIEIDKSFRDELMEHHKTEDEMLMVIDTGIYEGRKIDPSVGTSELPGYSIISISIVEALNSYLGITLA